MPLVGFEPTISAGERPQTYTLDGAATGLFFVYGFENWPVKKTNILRQIK